MIAGLSMGIAIFENPVKRVLPLSLEASGFSLRTMLSMSFLIS